MVIAACQKRGLDGQTAALAMILLDELRGRLAEVFSLKTFRIDHVVHGAIASAAVYGLSSWFSRATLRVALST